jgi:hypothetical protein
MGTVVVTLVRQTETHVGARGQPVLALAGAAQECLHGAPQRSEDQRTHLDPQLTAALQAHHRIAPPWRRRTPGQPVPHGTIVKTYEPTLAPIGTGQSHGPAPCGRTPGMSAAPAAGVLVARPLPGGHPRDASAVEDLIDTGEQAMARVGTRPTPALHALAGDLARHDAARREAGHARGMRTGGLPRTGEPLPASPPPQDVFRILDEADLHHIRTASPVHRA